MFDRRWLLALCLALAGIFFETNPAVAGVLDAAWTAPTTNTDGSQLTDLASYRVYFGTSATPCPSGTFVTVSSPNSTPPAGETVGTRLTGLTNNTVYNVSVAAVDTGGNPSACSGVASATATPDITVTPTTTVAFGNVNIGSFAEQSFTVQSNRAGVTGTASVPAPFTIVSGSPFSLSFAGATQTVTVRFTPTNLTAQSVNVNFTADGDSISRLVTGTGVPVGPTLTVTKSGAGTGTVTSSPTGIDCGAACAASYATGTQVTLTATPATGSTFTGWSGGGCTGTGTCVVTMTADTTVTAGFVVQSFALTVNTSGTGTGTVTSAPTGINCGSTCSTSFSSNTEVTLTATATTDSIFTGWSGACTGTGACVVTMNAAKAVTANFTVPTFVLTVNKVGGGTGTVTSTPAGINCGATCSFAFNNNTMVTLTAMPAAGAAFTGWTGACTGSGACTVTMSAARTVTAMFGVSTVTFTDAQLVPQTTGIKVVHVAELRTAIAMARARNGVPAFTWRDTLTAKTTAIKAAHINEMRTAINQIYQALGRTLPTYTDPALFPFRTVAKSAHIQELRNAVSALP
jgi:Divergent InlB B-repeat domain